MTEIISEARDRFQEAADYEKENRDEAIDDLLMLSGENHWDEVVERERTAEGRPVLVINKLPTFVDQVTNKSRTQKIGIKVFPYGFNSSTELADLYGNIIRGIEYQSDASVAYQNAHEGAANCGIGHFRVITEYPDDEVFDQDIRIQWIPNHLSVYSDPNHKEPDMRDCQYRFLVEDISKKEYERRYPGKPIGDFDMSSDPSYSYWFTKDTVRIAEYWRRIPVKKTLVLLSDGRTVDKKKWEELLAVVGEEESKLSVLKEREVNTWEVEQYIINGKEILEGPNKWVGKWIPIITVKGKELMVGNKSKLRGVIRFAKDPQRMYNYFRSTAVETVALAPKAPYVLEEGQVDGYEDEWSDVNSKNLPYVRYRKVPGVTAPQRQQTSQTDLGSINEMRISNDEMKATTSIYDASLGATSNEVSGRAITARTDQSDIANFTYQDNLVRAIKFCGDILVDLIPKIIDVERQLLIVKETEDQEIITVNQMTMGEDGEMVILNDLTQGKYKVTVSVGPSFSNQRLEAANSMMEFIRVAPQQASLLMDMIAENMGWPGSKKIANRYKKLLPPGIDEEGPAPPKEPSLDDMIKKLKAQGITLGNEKRKLDLLEKKREISGHDETMVKAGAAGAMRAMGLNMEGE